MSLTFCCSSEDPSVACSKLVYKLAFDTTETAGRDLFMIGIIPHSFSLSKKIQSSDNVIVLCLAKLAENPDIIHEAIPNLEAIISVRR
jgi:hypothetical protein